MRKNTPGAYASGADEDQARQQLTGFKKALGAFIEEVNRAAPAMGQVCMNKAVRVDHGFRLERTMVPDLQDVLMLLFSRIETFPSYDAILESLRQSPGLASRFLVDGVGQPIRSGSVGESTWVWNHVVEPILVRCLHEASGFPLSCETASKTADDLLSLTPSPARLLWPLRDMAMEPQRVDLGDGAALRRITEEEATNWANLPGQDPLYCPNAASIMRLDCALELVSASTPEARRLAVLLAALSFYLNRRIVVAFEEFGADGSRTIALGVMWDPESAEAPIVLDRQQCDEFKQLWDGVRKVQPEKTVARVELALLRWYAAHQRASGPDALIDCWVALETLFVPGKVQELRFRVALRLASFLADDDHRPGAIYSLVGKSYKYRSKIVHGEPRLPKDLNRVVAETGEYLRKALDKILRSATEFEPENLEEKLLSRIQRYLVRRRIISDPAIPIRWVRPQR